MRKYLKLASMALLPFLAGQDVPHTRNYNKIMQEQGYEFNGLPLSLGPDIKTGAGIKTLFYPITPFEGIDIQDIEFDFENDGIFDKTVSEKSFVQHTYPAPGTYFAKARMRLCDGTTKEAMQRVIVEPGLQKQEIMEPLHIPSAARYQIKKASGDTVQTNHLLYIIGSSEERFAEPIHKIYDNMTEGGIVRPENVTILAGESGKADSVKVKGPAARVKSRR
jgi:hypothetical protein